MNNKPLPRKRKVVINPGYEEPPKKDFIQPKIETKRVITGFRIGERRAKIIRSRQTIIEKIRQEYPQITDSQLDNASITYGDYHAKVELKQYSPTAIPQGTIRLEKRGERRE